MLFDASEIVRLVIRHAGDLAAVDCALLVASS
jgi:hypothetical protein